MVHRVLVLGQVLGLHQSDGHGVAKEHLDGRAGDGGQVEGAQLTLEREVNREVAGLVLLLCVWKRAAVSQRF